MGTIEKTFIRKNMKKIIIFFLCFSFPINVSAEINYMDDLNSGFWDGSDLNKACLSENEGLCFAYIMAVFDERNAWKGGWKNLEYPKICNFLPAGKIKLFQIVAIVKKYLNDHPEIYHFNAPKIILMAIAKAFCKSKGRVLDIDPK